jgi:hypothetical protein
VQRFQFNGKYLANAKEWMRRELPLIFFVESRSGAAQADGRERCCVCVVKPCPVDLPVAQTSSNVKLPYQCGAIIEVRLDVSRQRQQTTK